MMYVLILIDGEELSRWQVPKELIDTDGMLWQDRALAREQTIKLFIEWVKNKTHKQVQNFRDVSYQIAIDSRMNDLDDEYISELMKSEDVELFYSS
jgi:hypothetical protein